MKKTAAGLFEALSLLALVFLIIINIYLNLPFIFKNQRTCIFIQPNENFNNFLRNATQQTRYVSSTTLKIYSKVIHLDRHLIAGEYCFTPQDSIVTLMKKLHAGEREVHKFTLVDGWNYQDLIHHLALAPSLYNPAIINNSATIAAALHLAENQLEGQFYPETYYYAYPDTALNILQHAHFLMTRRLNFFYNETAGNKSFNNPNELLIAASIIQKEAGHPDEQMLVASVIVNRLKLKMRLQMDPTVIYSLGASFHVPLTKQDLMNDSPYNTYRHTGLPPAPICMPGETALYAAAHPKVSNYLYFVSKKNGYHQFSETLGEQTSAINQYLLVHNRDRLP